MLTNSGAIQVQNENLKIKCKCQGKIPVVMFPTSILNKNKERKNIECWLRINVKVDKGKKIIAKKLNFLRLFMIYQRKLVFLGLWKIIYEIYNQ